MQVGHTTRDCEAELAAASLVSHLNPVLRRVKAVAQERELIDRDSGAMVRRVNPALEPSCRDVRGI